MSRKDISPVSDDKTESPDSPFSSDEIVDSFSDNVHSIMTNSYCDISGDESMFEKLLSDDDDENSQERPGSLSLHKSNISDMVRESASNLTDELDSLVRQAYMDSHVVHEVANEVKEGDILEGAVGYDKQRASSDLSELQGITLRQGDMVSFVAEDLSRKIKLSSPSSRKSDTPSSVPGSRSSTPSLYKQALHSQVPLIDPNILNDLEGHAIRVASAVDTMLENLTGTLHSMSSLTVDCMDVYKESVCKTCDIVDSNIKTMYQLMAKCEELNQSMGPVYLLAHQTKEIKRVLELFEALIDGNK